MNSIIELLHVRASVDAKFSLLVMLHGHMVAALESFLASTFIHKITNSKKLIRRLVETDPKFPERSLILKQKNADHEKLELAAAKYLKRHFIFHRIKEVKSMYKKVLGCDFGDIEWLSEAVRIRHHCVHRAGLDYEGNKVEISIDSIRNLARRSQSFVDEIVIKIEQTPEL